MIYLIIYLTGVLFSIALYVFVQWKTKSPLYLGKLIAFTFFSLFSWITFIIASAVCSSDSDIIIFDFGKNARKAKMRE
jgi:glycopeptide antibiotics resistance protein